MSGNHRTIIYVPGMKPKPPVATHREMLWKCLLAGIGRADPKVASELAQRHDAFRLVAWSPLLYDETRDIELDRAGIERLLALPGPEARDLEEASHWHKRFARLVYLVGDKFPFLINLVANENLKATIQDSMRYFSNHGHVADRIRATVAKVIEEAWASGSRILLIAHSLGSVIAYETLWQLSQSSESQGKIDRFVTVGSPLGLNFIQHRLITAHLSGADKYPHNIRRWSNLSAIGEMTSLDRTFANDFREMLDLGLVENISDRVDLANYFRNEDGLNVHRCYGYAVNPQLGAVIADWWREGSA